MRFTRVTLWPAVALILSGAILFCPAPTHAQCGSGKMVPRTLAGPTPGIGSVPPGWLMQMQSQLAQAQMMHNQLAQAQMAQNQLAQQMLMAKGFNPIFGPAAQQATAPRLTRRDKSSSRSAVQSAQTKVIERNGAETVLTPAQLADDLLSASEDRQDAAREKLRDGKGADFTDALAAAILKLDGDAKARTRDALVERLARMNNATLRDKLADDDQEVRRAAVLACAMKDDRGFIPDLIALMEQEPPLTPAVRAALRGLTECDFGPTARAGQDERSKAIAAWKAWWQTTSQK